MKKQPISLYLLAFWCLLLTQSICLHCASSCDYSYSTSSSAYVKRCTSTSSTTACTACDTRFYTLSSTTCALNSQTIFNSSIEWVVGDWTSDSNVGTTTIDSMSDWQEFTGDGQVNAFYKITTPYYGLQCRVLMHVTQDSSFWPTLYFKINNTLTQHIELTPQLNTNYPFEQWIFTTPSIYKSSQPQIMISVMRNDSTANPSGDIVAFKDVRCLVAQCVSNCLSCTNLGDCNTCETGYYLDAKNKWCVSACPVRQYAYSSYFCAFCDPLCEKCTSSASTACTKCTTQGPFQSFLISTTCYLTCPNGTLSNYSTHKCYCPSQNYYNTSTHCYSCHEYCKTCTGPLKTNCQSCNMGYFFHNSSGETTCSRECLSGQYKYLVYDWAVCYTCSSLCTTCQNLSSICTSCTSFSSRWLFNNTCVTLCPDGYQGNNTNQVCEICPLSTYSYENVCYSECPLYYTADTRIRACVVDHGYPFNISFDVADQDTLKFVLNFQLGIKTSFLTALATSYSSYVTLKYSDNSRVSEILDVRRMLSTSTTTTSMSLSQPSFSKMTISSAKIANTSLIFYSTTISPSDLIKIHSFSVNFTTNLQSPKNVIYRIGASNTTQSAPWVVKKYFDMNTTLYYLLGSLLGVAGILLLLVNVRNSYNIVMEYVRNLQIVGLLLYSLYPFCTDLNSYSLVLGFEYVNLSFMYNAPKILISPCYNCATFTGYSFILGDMDWLRLMGSVLPMIGFMLIICGLFYAFKFSREYSLLLFKIVLDFVLVKSIQGWFVSLVYAGFNLFNSEGGLDYYILAMHACSYLVLVPLLYPKLIAQKNNRHPNVALIYLFVYVCLMCIISISPILISALVVFVSFTQILYMYMTNTTEQQKPANREQLKLLNSQKTCTPLIFHNILLRGMKPLTFMAISCTLFLNTQITTISIISSAMGTLLIFLLADVKMLSKYQGNQDQSKVSPMDQPNPSEENVVRGGDGSQDGQEMEDKDVITNFLGYEHDDISQGVEEGADQVSSVKLRTVEVRREGTGHKNRPSNQSYISAKSGILSNNGANGFNRTNRNDSNGDNGFNKTNNRNDGNGNNNFNKTNRADKSSVKFGQTSNRLQIDQVKERPYPGGLRSNDSYKFDEIQLKIQNQVTKMRKDQTSQMK